MIVADPFFDAIDGMSLQHRCRPTQPHDEKRGFLQRCPATESLHCNPLSLERGSATICHTEKEQPDPIVDRFARFENLDESL